MMQWQQWLFPSVVSLWMAHSVLAASSIAHQTSPAVPLGPPSSLRDGDEIRSSVQEVLSAPEYRHLVRPKPERKDVELPGWLERFLDWLLGNRRGELNGPSLSWAAMLLRALVYLVGIAILALIAVVIVRGVLEWMPAQMKSRRVAVEEELAPTIPPGELPSDEYLRRALGLAATGDYKAAIRELLLGTMSWIERAGLIRFRRGLCNRDYLRAVWRRPLCRDSMTGIVEAFDRTYFGRRSATCEMFERCLELYRQGFTGNETVSLAS